MRKIEINSENNYKIDDDLILFKFSNIDPQTKSIFFETKTNFIQFRFCLKGECNFIYNNGSYCLPLKNEISILLFLKLIKFTLFSNSYLSPISFLKAQTDIKSEKEFISVLFETFLSSIEIFSCS